MRKLNKPSTTYCLQPNPIDMLDLWHPHPLWQCSNAWSITHTGRTTWPQANFPIFTSRCVRLGGLAATQQTQYSTTNDFLQPLVNPKGSRTSQSQVIGSPATYSGHEELGLGSGGQEATGYSQAPSLDTFVLGLVVFLNFGGTGAKPPVALMQSKACAASEDPSIVPDRWLPPFTCRPRKAPATSADFSIAC